MQNKTIRVVTRSSALAIKQTEEVIEMLKQHTTYNIEIIQVTQSVGDVNLKDPLYQMGGIGVFTKQVEQYLLDNQADIAVHSLKDLPTIIDQSLYLAAYKKLYSNPISYQLYSQPRSDVLILNQKHAHIKSLDQLPPIIGTSSLRRIASLKHRYPNLELKNIRGNLNTRLNKLDSGEYDGIILAKAGIVRLGFTNRISIELGEKEFLHAPAQGALGIQCRNDNEQLKEILRKLNDKETQMRCVAERQYLNLLEGGCKLPIGVYSELTKEDNVYLKSKVWSPDGKIEIEGEAEGNYLQVGELLCKKMKEKGADDVLKQNNE